MGLILVKAVVPHWSKYFDTLRDMQEANQLIRVEPVRPKTQLHTSQLEYIPWGANTLRWEQDETAPPLTNTRQTGLGEMESLIPGIAHGEIYDEDKIREGGSFVYPNILQYLGDLPRINQHNVLIGSTQKPDYVGGIPTGRKTLEGTVRGGFDPDQVFLISDPKIPFLRHELVGAFNEGFGRRPKTPQQIIDTFGPEYQFEPRKVAAEALLAAGYKNPDMRFQNIWNQYIPKTVDRELLASRNIPYFQSVQGIPQRYLDALETNELSDLPLNPKIITGEPMEISYQLLKELCAAGKAAAKKKFKVYPSAYANGWAVQYCQGKFRKKKKVGVKK